MSNTQTIYKNLLNMPVFEPSEPKAKKTKYGEDDKCWLCGGEAEGLGHHLKDVITSSFTDTNSAKCLTSKTVCYSCAALMKKEAWELACAKHGHSPFFPVKDGKAPFLSNWMFSSHVFSADGWKRPDRKDLADILLNPPSPPFVVTIADAGKKHVIFRAKVNNSKDTFFIQMDDETIFIDRILFSKILDLVKIMYESGFSKDSILTGEYNQAAIIKFGLSAWHALECIAKQYRYTDQQMLRVACFVVQKDPT